MDLPQHLVASGFSQTLWRHSSRGATSTALAVGVRHWHEARLSFSNGSEQAGAA